MTTPKYFVFFKQDGTPQQDMTVCVEPGGELPTIPGTTCMEVAQDSGVALINMRLVNGEVVESIPDEPVTDAVGDARVRAKINLQRDYAAAVSAGFEWNGKMLQAGTKARSAIQLYVATSTAALVDSHPFPTIEFTCSDNSVMMIPATDWAEIGARLATHLNTTHAKYQRLKAAIASAPSVETLEQIKW